MTGKELLNTADIVEKIVDLFQKLAEKEVFPGGRWWKKETAVHDGNLSGQELKKWQKRRRKLTL